jgi:hypothetical protein
MRAVSAFAASGPLLCGGFGGAFVLPLIRLVSRNRGRNPSLMFFVSRGCGITGSAAIAALAVKTPQKIREFFHVINFRSRFTFYV